MSKVDNLLISLSGNKTKYKYMPADVYVNHNRYLTKLDNQ